MKKHTRKIVAALFIVMVIACGNPSDNLSECLDEKQGVNC